MINEIYTKLTSLFPIGAAIRKVDKALDKIVTEKISEELELPDGGDMVTDTLTIVLTGPRDQVIDLKYLVSSAVREQLDDLAGDQLHGDEDPYEAVTFEVKTASPVNVSARSDEEVS